MPDEPGAGFRIIQRQASCVFAARARIEAAKPFHGADAYTAGLEAAATMADFTSRVRTDELDGLLIELTRARHGGTLEALAVTTREVLAGLLAGAGDGTADALAEAGSAHWWLTLYGTRWFVLVFAPCYPDASPRFTFGSGSTFLLLQPVTSFDRHATPRGGLIADEVRRMIRRSYLANGRPYDAELAQQDVEALKFVWPLHLGDASCRWWRSGIRADGKSG